MSVEENMQLMKTLDDAWNSQDWETFNERHADDVIVFWPGQPEATKGIANHQEESKEFFKTFPDNHIKNDPYMVLFGQDDWTCSIAIFTGTMKGPMKTEEGEIPATNKKFKVKFCTVAHWKNGKIVEENLFYDQVGLMKQIGIM
ncbi:MAG: ester cyclase [Methanobacterium sp.]